MKNLLFFLLLGVLLAAGCREDDVVDCDDFTNPACSNYDPCHDQEEVSAEFETSIVLYASPDVYEVFVYDTFFLNSTVTFEAKDKNAEYYEWRVGNDNRTWNTSSFSLTFNAEDSSSILDRPILVTLIMRKKPNNSCFPNDDGMDTLTKPIYFVRYSENNMPYLGTWRGTREDNPGEVYDIRIYQNFAIGYSTKRLFLENLENHQIDCVKQYYSPTTRYAYNGVFGLDQLSTDIPAQVCQHLYNYGPTIRVNRADNTIEIKWKWVDVPNTNESVVRKFVGKKIQ